MLSIKQCDFIALGISMYQNWHLAPTYPPNLDKPSTSRDSLDLSLFDGLCLNEDPLASSICNMVKHEEPKTSNCASFSNDTSINTIKMIKDMLLIDIDVRDCLTI